METAALQRLVTARGSLFLVCFHLTGSGESVPFQHPCCARVCRRTRNPWSEVSTLVSVDMSGNSMWEN